MSQEETRFRRFPLACCQISELNCSKAPLNRRSSTTILSNICLIAAPILAPNLPISGNTAEYPATGSSIKNPVFMRVCGHFEARRTTRHDPNVITPKVALQRPPQKKLNKGLQFDFDRAIIIYQTRPYSSAG